MRENGRLHNFLSLIQMTLFLSPPISNPPLPILSLFTNNCNNRRCSHRQQHRIYFKQSRVASSQSSIDSPEEIRKTGVIVIGAGLAGLAAAIHLKANNIPFLLLEASNAVGGRVRTDVVDGFLLDRGFQIFITGYPEAQSLLDYDALDLRKFYSGARVYYGGTFHRVADPFRHFGDSIQSLFNPIGTLLDKLLIAVTRIRVLVRSDDEIMLADEVKTIDLLKSIGFSDSILDRFFRPFFGGIFFDTNLETTSRLFDFIFKCLALGDNTLPSKGISAIPEQLAAKLHPDSIILNSRVVSINSDSSTVRLQTGEVFSSEHGIVVAVEQPEAVKLLAGAGTGTGKESVDNPVRKPVRSTVCLYFTAGSDEIPVRDPVLFLNGTGKGIVNNMFFASNVSGSYAPAGKGLISVSVMGLMEGRSDEDLRAEVLRELSGWFGERVVGKWRHLRTYRIEFAQPNQSPPTDLMKDPRVRVGLYLCGDYQKSATFDGALVSGRKAVEDLLRDGSLLKLV